MTPEAGRYLAKARLTLDHARKMLTVQLNEDAGRAAYLAGFQAAQALIFERTGTVTKTHKGAHRACPAHTQTSSWPGHPGPRESACFLLFIL